MPELRLDSKFLIPHLAVDADVPVLVHHNVIITVVQHTQVLQTGRLCSHHGDRWTGTHAGCKKTKRQKINTF